MSYSALIVSAVIFSFLTVKLGATFALVIIPNNLKVSCSPSPSFRS